MPSITYASSLEVEVYTLVVDVGLNYVTVNYQSTSLLSTFHSSCEFIYSFILLLCINFAGQTVLYLTLMSLA